MTDDVFRTLRRELVRAFSFAAAVTLFVNLGTLFVPVYDMILFDRVMPSRNMDTLTVLSVGCVFGMVIYAVLEFCRSITFLVMGDRLARRLNIPVLQAAIAKTLDGQTMAASQAMRDLNDLRQFVTGSAAAIPLDLLWSPALLAVLFMLHPAFGLYGIVCALILFGISVLTDRQTRAPLTEANTAMTRSVNELSAVLHNTDLLDGMGMLPAVARRWQRRQNGLLAGLNRTSRHNQGFAAAAKTCRLLMQGGIIALGVVLVIRSESTPGAMMGANLIVAKLLSPFEQLVSGWRQWSFALAALGRVRSLLEGRASSRAMTAQGSVQGVVSLENLTFAPPSLAAPIINGLTLRIEPGEVIGIVGPSAAGKSTLARLITGVLVPTGGRVRLDGHDTSGWERQDFGSHVGYVPQSVSLLDGTIFDNIARMGEASSADVVAAATLAGIHDVIGRLPKGYDTRIGGAAPVLSGGQSQRVALARALFGKPKLVVLDEPNANLDHAGEQALIATIATLKAQGTGVILVTHRPALIAAVDKLLVLNKGKIQHFGPKGEVQAALAAAAESAPADSLPVPVAAQKG